MNPQTPQPDQSVLALTKAIRQKESGGKYDAIGDAGTSKGAYQFQADTWKGYAKEILGDENAEMSDANQNAVTYGKIKKWKDQGWGPAQIAAAWNAGEGRAADGSWVNHKGSTIRNGQKIDYDTPSYVKGVVDIYKQIAQGKPNIAPKRTFSEQIKEIQSSQPQQVEEPKKEGVGKKIAKALIGSPLTILARPFQAGAALLGADTADIDKVSSKISGGLIAPTPKGAGDVGKDVLRAGETVLSGLVAGKAAKGIKAARAAKTAAPLQRGAMKEAIETSVDLGRGAKGPYTIAEFAKRTPAEQYNILSEAVGTAKNASDKLLLQEALKMIEPLAKKELGIKTGRNLISRGLTNEYLQWLAIFGDKLTGILGRTFTGRM